MNLFDKALAIWEKGAFGVCTYLGNRMNIKSTNIRMAFIYLSFITFGSPLFLYLVFAWLLKHKHYFFRWRKKSTVWDIDWF
ncbi:MAG: PspC family transcriptional regulator [Bacteroidota bacterium]